MRFEAFDTAYFDISVVGQKNLPKWFSPGLADEVEKRVISFEVTEEAGKFITGSLSMYDDDQHSLSYLLKRGAVLDIEWGYKIFIENPIRSLSMRSAVPPKRRLKAMVTNPAGEGGSDGKIAFNCNFMQFSDSKDRTHKKFPAGTMYSGIVYTMMSLLGIPASNCLINFTRMNETVPKGKEYVCSNETPFQFLHRLANEIGAIFKVDYASAKSVIPMAIFVTMDSITELKVFSQRTTGGIGLYNEFRYKTAQEPNVRSYSWQLSEMDSGAGDSARIVMINGQPQIIRSKAEAGVVKWYKFNPDVMRAEMAKAGSYEAKTAIFKAWMDASNFQELIDKKYFIPCESTTAPQGVGLQTTLTCVGNPLVIVPNRTILEGSFPEYFVGSTEKGLTFYTRKATHKIDKGGYSMTADIVDAFTYSGGSLIG